MRDEKKRYFPSLLKTGLKSRFRVKAQAKSSLNLSRGISLIQEDLTEARQVGAYVRTGKLHPVERVEELHAEVEVVPFGERDLLCCKYVEVLRPR